MDLEEEKPEEVWCACDCYSVKVRRGGRSECGSWKGRETELGSLCRRLQDLGLTVQCIGVHLG